MESMTAILITVSNRDGNASTYLYTIENPGSYWEQVYLQFNNAQGRLDRGLSSIYLTIWKIQ